MAFSISTIALHRLSELIDKEIAPVYVGLAIAWDAVLATEPRRGSHQICRRVIYTHDCDEHLGCWDWWHDVRQQPGAG